MGNADLLAAFPCRQLVAWAEFAAVKSERVTVETVTYKSRDLDSRSRAITRRTEAVP